MCIIGQLKVCICIFYILSSSQYHVYVRKFRTKQQLK
uniref:Uncharacterized protein n=1 Tax=Brassica oleracea TaxID=3712 RepID=A0A3P6GYS8_BRAOL|nr:unnamed protein product [Brassica oleracea]